MHKVRLATAAALLLLGGASLASADTITVGGGTTGTGPYELVSTSTTFSFVKVALSTPIAFSSITSLDAVFNDITGGADGGSPRIVLSTPGADFFLAYLGTPPNFNDSNPAAFTSAFSGLNLDNGTNNSTFQNANTYQTFASLQTTFGADLINDVTFAVDGGFAANGAQDLTLSALDLNGVNLLAPSAVPEPLTLSLFGAGLAGAAAIRRRRKKAKA